MKRASDLGCLTASGCATSVAAGFLVDLEGVFAIACSIAHETWSVTGGLAVSLATDHSLLFVDVGDLHPKRYC